MGGLTPYEPLPGCIPPPGVVAVVVVVVSSAPLPFGQGQPFGGWFPLVVIHPQDGPPLGIAQDLLSIPGRYCYRFLQIYHGLSWANILVSSRVVFTVDYLYHVHVFFQIIVLRRNCYIKNVVLFEEKSILVFPECLEASEWQFLKSDQNSSVNN